MCPGFLRIARIDFFPFVGGDGDLPDTPCKSKEIPPFSNDELRDDGKGDV